jgi:hypothetical protein
MGRLELQRCMSVQGLGRCKARMTIGHPGPRAAHRKLVYVLLKKKLFLCCFVFTKKWYKSFTHLCYEEIYIEGTPLKDTGHAM